MLGQPSIGSINENSRGAKSMLRAYDSVLLAELRSNTWKFAIKRASIAASAFPPIFGKPHAYPLPGDFLYLAPDEINYHLAKNRDWEIEGLQIITSDPTPLEVRYVSSNITESTFDALFAEALAYSLALATSEELTNSNSKLQNISGLYDQVIKRARKRNSIESAPVKPPVPSWISVRQ